MISVIPSTYFGNIHYYQTVFNKASIQIEAFEHIDKQSLRNRCEILTPNGVQSITIPINKLNGSKTPINLVEIANNQDWRKDHWKAIESAYSASPYFEHYEVEVKNLIYQEEKNLLKFNQKIIETIIDWLSLPVEINFTTEYMNSNEIEFEDFRKLLSDKKNNFINHPKYIQVFNSKEIFNYNLSILDAIFCIGPMARKLL